MIASLAWGAIRRPSHPLGRRPISLADEFEGMVGLSGAV